MIKTISSVLYNPVPSLKIVLVVTLERDGTGYMSMYQSNKGDFITVSTMSHISIRYQQPNTEWSSLNQVQITQRNIFQLRIGLSKFYKQFQREDLFQYDTNDKIIGVYPTKYDIVVVNMGAGRFIQIMPAVIMDNKGVLLPGVRMNVNIEKNEILLAIEEFEGMLDLFNHIDIYQASITLLQLYAATYPAKQDKLKPVNQTPVKIQKRSIFDKSHDEPTEYVQAPPKVSPPLKLEDL